MTGLTAFSLLAAGATLLVLELAYLLYRRRFPRLLERARYQVWAATVAIWLALAFGSDPPSYPRLEIWSHFLFVVQSAYLAWRLIARLWLAQQRDARGRLAVPKLMRDLIGFVVLFVAIVWAGHGILGFEYSKFLLPSAVVSAVLGFALQDVLKNVFAGLSLQNEAPFETGDWLLMDGQPRQVLEMSWRSTRLRDNLGHEFSVPNSDLAAAHLENLGTGNPPMGFEVEVGVVYDAPPREVKDAIERAARLAPVVAAEPPPIGLLTSFGESGVVYRLRFWSSQVHGVARMLDQVRTRVWYELKRSGFAIAFPVRVVEHSSQRDLAEESLAERRARADARFAKVAVLAALPAEARQRLSAGAPLLHFDDGEALVREGEKGDSLLVIERGRVRISKSGVDIGASTVALATLGEGDCFGEMSLLTGAPRSATVVAEGAVDVFVLDRRALTPLLREDPSLAETLSRVLARRVTATVALFEDRREEIRRQAPPEPHSLLEKIRDFFRLD